MNETLKAFLAMNVPKTKKKAKGKIVLGVCEERLGSAIQVGDLLQHNDSCFKDALGIQCEKSQTVRELTRGIRLHFHHFIPALKSGDLEKAQLGLGHSYSRCKVKFNVHRQDNMIIQSKTACLCRSPSLLFLTLSSSLSLSLCLSLCVCVNATKPSIGLL